MTTIKVCSGNMEWMNDWFTPDTKPADFRPTFSRDGHENDTHATANRVASLIRAIDPDIMAIQEAPSRPEEMALFTREYLADAGVPRYQFFLSDSGRQQKLALLYKPASLTSADLAPSSDIGMLINPWQTDVDGDGFLGEYNFTRVPLVINLEVDGSKLQVIVMHTKSNFVNKGREMWENAATRQNYIIEALKNRRRISAEGMRLRKYIDEILKNNPQARIVVLGDLNDGPGMDYFEEYYLTHNVTDIIIGSAFMPEWMFLHAQHDVLLAQRYTAIFDDFVTKELNKHSLLDHIIISPALGGASGLRKVPQSGMINHAEYNAQVVNEGVKRENRPSDHRPVSVMLEY